MKQIVQKQKFAFLKFEKRKVYLFQELQGTNWFRSRKLIGWLKHFSKTGNFVLTKRNKQASKSN